MKISTLLLLVSPIVCSDASSSEVSNKRYFKFGANLMPHPEKIDKGGEDALVAAHNLMVVADGVGGWADHGIDPGMYSKQLVADFKSLYDKDNNEELINHLLQAHRQNPNQGSCTFYAAKFDPSRENFIKTINLGDSGYMILRPNSENSKLKKIFRTKE